MPWLPKIKTERINVLLQAKYNHNRLLLLVGNNEETRASLLLFSDGKIRTLVNINCG
jgi:hypothetical protein